MSTQRQRLFDHLMQEHGVTALESELNEIITLAQACAEPIGYVEAIRPISGKFCSFEEGEVAKLLHDDGELCTIERIVWKGSTVPLCNQLYGVPRTELRLLLPGKLTLVARNT